MGCSGCSTVLLVVSLLATFRHVTGMFPMLCGEDLVTAVASVCQERGYYVQPSKRSVTEAFQPESHAKSFLRMSLDQGASRVKRRIRTGLIVTECCMNSCSISILESYCNPLPQGTTHQHEPIHARRHGKSAEDDIAEEIQGRPLAGPSQVDKPPSREREENANAAASPAAVAPKARGRNRMENVEDALGGRSRSTSSSTKLPSNSPPPRSSSRSSSMGRKARKEKNARRKSSREAKEARREERRRQRERASGGRSRSGRRRNKDTATNGRAMRLKRHSLLSLPGILLHEDDTRIEKARAAEVRNGIAPSTVTLSTVDRTGRGGARRDDDIARSIRLSRETNNKLTQRAAVLRRKQAKRSVDIHDVLDRLRSFVSVYVDGR